MTILNSEHLIDQGDRLATRPAAGAPRQADLRRAVSSAYYALFHAVLLGAADLVVGQARRSSVIYSLVYRTPNHGQVRKRFNEVLNNSGAVLSYLNQGEFGADAIAFARAFVELHEKRHLSDYDPLYRITASEAAVAIATGRAALVHWNAIPREQKDVILLLCLFQAR
mgnify:CR=1 FL=1